MALLLASNCGSFEPIYSESKLIDLCIQFNVILPQAESRVFPVNIKS